MLAILQFLSFSAICVLAMAGFNALGHKDNTLTIIDWDSDIKHLPERFGLKQTSYDTAYQWRNYVSSLISNIILPVAITNVQDVLVRLTNQPHCRHITQYVQNETALSAPCHGMHFISTKLCEMIWTITVIDLFIINITIEKASVPYSKFCKSGDSYIAINEGHNTMFCSQGFKCAHTIQYYCGYVYMDSTYSKGNKAMLKIKSNVQNVPYPTMILASYSVHCKGWAYKYSYELFTYYYGIKFYPNNMMQQTLWNIKVLPSLLLFADQFLYCIWYIANDVTQVNKPVILTKIVQVNRFSCSNVSSASIHIFPGLLSLQMIKWDVQPVYTCYCNITIMHVCMSRLTFHMYMTVALIVTNFDNPVSLEMTIVNSYSALKPLVNVHDVNNIPLMTNQLGSIKAAYLPPSNASLQLQFLHSSAPYSTVNANQIQAINDKRAASK